MINRRTFLRSTGTLSLSLLAAGCSSGDRPALQVRLLKNSIPAQLLPDFRRYLQKQGPANAQLDFKPEAQLANLFALLQEWQRSAQSPPAKPLLPLPFISPNQAALPPDLLTLGDAWLAVAIRQGLIQPLQPQAWSAWNQMPQRWRTVVTRNRQGQLDAHGQVWAAPYRWGATVIAYRKDLLAERKLPPPTDWADLWRPDLKGQISLLDQPREVIGLTLKKLGKSYNTPDLTLVPQLKPELQSLHRQTKFYSSNSYLQPLLLGDTWVAVGWSTDIVPLLQQNQPIAVVIPPSGTLLSADLWVHPTRSTAVKASDPTLLDRWINFCWQPETVQQLSLLGTAPSPLWQPGQGANLEEAERHNPGLLTPESILQRSDFLEPLTEATVEQYRSLWAVVRRGE